MVDGEYTERDDLDLEVLDEATRADRASRAARNTAEGNSRRDRLEPGYVELESSDLQKLEELCIVLDISYNQKLKEFGMKAGNKVKTRVRSRVLDTILSLQQEKNEGFNELRHQARSLILLWKRTHAPVKRDLLDAAFALSDAESADEISAAKFLRSSFEDDLKDDIDRLELAEETERRAKYETRKIKLKKLMKSTHLVAADIDFDPDKQVEDEMLSQVTSTMKSKIDEVRSSILDRKELVFRIETAQEAVTNAWPYRTVRVLLQRAKVEALKVKATCRDLKYDGLDIAVLLSGLEKAASSVVDAAAEACLQNPPDSTDFVRATTCSGARFNRSIPVTEDTDIESDVNTNLDWNMVDKKKMLNAVYRVRDLDATIESYKSDFGMKLLRKVEYPERRCTFALVGFGPESNMFALKLAHYENMDEFNIGDGFGNIGIACKVHEVCDRIKTASRCKITCLPARLTKDSTLIAVSEESNGYLFELIEKGQALHMCHVMLRVSNLDRSIKFYEKGLGMKVAVKKDLPAYKCAIAQLRYGGVEKITHLELTSNYGVQQYSKGDAFMEITVGTDNVERSLDAVEKAIEELGGKVLQRPGQTVPATEQPRAVASFEDPDGYKVVLVDNVNFLKEVAVRVADDTDADGST